MNNAQKENRGQASLVSKLTRKEVWRRFWLLVSVDILIVIIFFIGIIVYSDEVAANCDFTQPLPPNMTFSEHDTRPDGIPFGIDFVKLLNLDFGWMDEASIYRNIWFETPRDVTVFSDENETIIEMQGLEAFHYSFSTRKLDDPAKYLLVTFSYPFVMHIFSRCFVVLLTLQVIGLFFDIFDIRKSIRKSLRPIYDLTLAAKNMNATANPVVKLPGMNDLQLSGAIDTLNNITEDDLGQRIVIGDEREELRGLAEAINAMLDRLDAAYRSQLRFVSDASHELRTPIAVIQGYANMLDRWGKRDTDTLQESIDAIKTEAGGMQDLVEQLLFLARSDNRSIVLSVTTVNTYALADEVLRETQMIDPNHEFAARLTEGLQVRGDIQLLKQALRIFVDNAIKYTPNGGKITLSTVSEDNWAKISVSDTGIGIPAKDLERVFDRFFRSDESRTRGTGGTGLGLSIAKWIIDRHGGFVEIVSREDFGTKVTIGLPAVVVSGIENRE